MSKFNKVFNLRIISIISILFLFTSTLYSASIPENCLRVPLGKDNYTRLIDLIPEEDIRNISYYLDQVEYVGDRELREKIADPAQVQSVINRLFPIGIKRFFIQNNRKFKRATRCSGRCWYCYAHRIPLLKRQEETHPIDLSDAVSIVDRTIEMGFDVIEVNGEDTLDDLESFWAIVDACKDKKVAFAFFTNGFYLLRNSKDSLEFFRELKERLGNAERVGMTFSWDPEKVARLKELPEFHNKEDLVLKAMAHLIHNFWQVFPRDDSYAISSLRVEAHDVGAASERQEKKLSDKFHQRLQSILQSEYGYGEDKSLYGYDIYTELLGFHTPEAVVEAIKRGRIYRQFTVEELFRMMDRRQRSSCGYSPFFDMSMGEIVTCIRRQEYPRRSVTPETFDDVLIEPFSNPRSRHLFLGEEHTERRIALVKQLGFALSLKPSLRQSKQVSFEEVEAHIFTDEELMTKVELLHLLEDLLYMVMDREDRSLFMLQRVPQELIKALLSEEILGALWTYYSDYLVEGDRIPLREEIIDRIRLSPKQAINILRDYLEKEIVPYLRKNVILYESVDVIPEIFSKVARDDSSIALPSLKDMGVDVVEKLEVSLGSDDEKERDIGFNLLGAMVRDGYDLNRVKDVLFSSLAMENLSVEEQELVIELFEEWTHKKKVLNMYDLNFVIRIIIPFVYGPVAEIREKALKFLIDLDDKMFVGDYVEERRHILPKDEVERYLDNKTEIFSVVDTITKIQLYRKWREYGLISLQEACEEIASLISFDVGKEKEIDILWKEIDKWGEEIDPFVGLLRDYMERSAYKRNIVIELLGKSREGKRVIADVIQKADYKDYGCDYLDALGVLVQAEETKGGAIYLLNTLPMTFFEQEEVFGYLVKDWLYRKLLVYHRAPEAEVMIRWLATVCVDKSISSVLDSYFAELGKKKGSGKRVGFKLKRLLLNAKRLWQGL